MNTSHKNNFNTTKREDFPVPTIFKKKKKV